MCQAEIQHYRQIDRHGALAFIDIAQDPGPMPADLSRDTAMARLHVRLPNGRLVSGAAAFVEIWSRLPRWRWAARLAALPGMTRILEWGYRISLRLRPRIARILERRRVQINEERKARP